MKINGNSDGRRQAGGRPPGSGGGLPPRRPAKKRRLSPFRMLILSLCVIAAVIAVAVGVLFSQIRPPDAPGDADPTARPSGALPHKTDIALKTDLRYGSPVYSEGEAPDLQSDDRRPGVYTLALLVSDDGGSQTDAMLVATFDTERGTVHALSLPRDTLVSVSRHTKKLNAAFGYGGFSQLKKEMRSVLGFSPDYYVHIDLDGFIALVDAVGGVDFYVPMDMNYDDPSQNLHIHFKEGLQPLNGQQAMEVLRYRQDNPDANGHIRGYNQGDLRRIEVQQDFLMAVAAKMVGTMSPGKISNYITLYANYVETNLETGNLVWFGMEALACGTENIHMDTLPTTSVRYTANALPIDYEQIRSAEAIVLINETINPRTRDITRGDVSHITLGDIQPVQTAPPATAPPQVSAEATPDPGAEATPTPTPMPTDPPETAPPTQVPIVIPDPVPPSDSDSADPPRM
ncbi:LCP family protein [Oscillospiraceae bacterium OttesenSCG-928-F05]|nr:LCP family protein [Oscillospiraceae bacterium OttesenSCG-928-F05]